MVRQTARVCLHRASFVAGAWGSPTKASGPAFLYISTADIVAFRLIEYYLTALLFSAGSFRVPRLFVALTLDCLANIHPEAAVVPLSSTLKTQERNAA